MPIERCAECGFDPADLRPADTAVAVRSFARRYRVPLTRGLPDEDLEEIVRWRPAPDVWSALEYAAHVRDIFRVLDDRVRCSLAGTEPDEPIVDWEGKVEANSGSLDRQAVADDLADAADTLGTTLGELTTLDWERTGMTGRGRPVPVVELAIIAVHEGSHHLLDVGRSLRSARGR